MIRSIQTKEDTLAHSGSDDAGARDHLAEAFRGYLTRERGLARGTVDNYSHGAALFLARLPDPLVPLESRIRAVDLGFVAASGGSDVLIDEAAQDRFSSDSLGIEVGHGDAGHVVQAAGDALGDALVRLGCVVVRLVFGQDGAQMPLAEDQEPVQELAAQGADEPFADRVHPRSLDRGAQDRGAAGLEDRVEGAGEVRAAIADQEPDVREPPGDIPTADSPSPAGRLRGRCSRPSAAGLAPFPRVVPLRGQSVVPGQQRRWHDGEDLGPAPAGQEPGQRGEAHPVGRLVSHPADVAAQHRVLMPEHQQLSGFRSVAAERQDSHSEELARQQVGDLEQHPASQPSPHQARW